jgi:hypothetical protein
MSIDIDDLPVIETTRRLGRRGHGESAVADAYSVTSTPLNDVAGSLATSVSKVLDVAATLQQKLMPTAAQLSEIQEARAATVSYTQDLDCSNQGDYNGPCDEACYGFPPAQMDPFYCGTCAEQAADPKNNPSYNWHFVGARGDIQYMDREPDICPPGKDAWKWKVPGPCGECANTATFRCHDGFKRYADGTLAPTICQGLVECDNRLTVCE